MEEAEKKNVINDFNINDFCKFQVFAFVAHSF